MVDTAMNVYIDSSLKVLYSKAANINKVDNGIVNDETIISNPEIFLMCLSL